MHWYMEVMRKYSDFSGRSRRMEYWMFFLLNIVVSLIVAVIGTMLHVPYLSFLYAAVIIVPSLAVTARRLHDTGRSGWWMLIALIPILGALVLLYFMAIDGDPGDNAYGPNPKAATA